jgi:hypothetical protein
MENARMFLGLSRSLGVLVTGAVLSIAAVGCSGGQAKGTLVKGVVTVKGKPAAGVIINFHSDSNQVASTTTLADGRYTLEGVPSGAVTVSLMSVSGLPGGAGTMPGAGAGPGIPGGPGAPPGMPGMPGMPGAPGGKKPSTDVPKGTPMDTVAKTPEIPGKFSKAETSTLKYTVEGKEQTIDIIVP